MAAAAITANTVILGTKASDWPKWIRHVRTQGSECWKYVDPERLPITERTDDNSDKDIFITMRPVKPPRPRMEDVGIDRSELAVTPDQAGTFRALLETWKTDYAEYCDVQEKLETLKWYVFATITVQNQRVLDPEMDLHLILRKLKAHVGYDVPKNQC